MYFTEPLIAIAKVLKTKYPAMDIRVGDDASEPDKVIGGGLVILAPGVSPMSLADTAADTSVPLEIDYMLYVESITTTTDNIKVLDGIAAIDKMTNKILDAIREYLPSDAYLDQVDYTNDVLEYPLCKGGMSIIIKSEEAIDWS